MAQHNYTWGLDEADMPEELQDGGEVSIYKGHKIEQWPYDGDVYGAIDGKEYMIGWVRDDYRSVKDILNTNPNLVKDLGEELARLVAEHEFEEYQ
jgi:hypothetical protein